MIAAEIPFYMDWKFWSLIVSIVALILSQLPPIHILLRRAQLDIEAYNRIYLTHKVGNANAQMHVIISNTGGRELKIRNIELQIQRENETPFVLPAVGYLQSAGDKSAILLTSFKLKPKEEWAHIVNFVRPFSRKQEKEYRQYEKNLRSDIIAKREKSDDLATADEENVKPLLEMFMDRFTWYEGEYQLNLKIYAEPGNVTIIKNYRITLFESDTSELKEYANDYKYGFGVYIDDARHSGIIVPVV